MGTILDKVHKEGLITLYKDQLKRESETSFMKAVLRQALIFLNQPDSNPRKIENWVVTQEKLSRSSTAFKL